MCKRPAAGKGLRSLGTLASKDLRDPVNAGIEVEVEYELLPAACSAQGRPTRTKGPTRGILVVAERWTAVRMERGGEEPVGRMSRLRPGEPP